MAATPNYVESLVAAEPLDTVRLDVRFKYLRKIEAKRAEALETGWLIASDDDYVPASLTVGETSMPAKIRLKGDGLDHWQGDKWSFRVKVQSEDRPFGMRVFSLQHPKSRWYLNEWGFLESLRTEGVLAVRYRFVDVILNGDDMGIYALEEHFDKHLLEAHERREGVILAFDEPTHFHADVQLRDAGGYVGTQFANMRNQSIRVFNESSVNANPTLRAQANEAIELLRAYQEGRRPASEVFDIPLLARYYAIADLWRASHATFWCNLRYYYNPINCRLEPIGYDSMALWGEPDHPLIAARRDDFTDNHALSDPIISAAYLRELDRISQPAYLEHLRAQLTPAFDRWRRALQREFPTERRVQPQWDTIAARQAYIRRALNPDRQVLATVHPLESGANEIAIDLRSIALLPVEVTAIRVNDHTIPGEDITAATQATGNAATEGPLITLAPSPPEQPIKPETLIVRLPEPISLDAPPRIEIDTRFVGRDETIAQSAVPAPPRAEYSSAPQSLSVDEALKRHAFLQPSDANTLRIAPGDWNVQGDLIIPDGFTLIAGPDTTLRFERDRVLYTTGALQFSGTASAPVRLEPQSDAWSGICVNEAANQSTWEHVRVAGTTGVTRGGWMLSGGVTFYKSNVNLKQVAFTDAQTEDALNVVHATVSMRDVAFANTLSDAFDGDFVHADIDGIHYTDIGGDGLDVSGSQVTARNVFARRIVDKVVSVGERSRVDVDTLDASTVGIALASKDDSDASLRDASIRNARIALAAYVKKPQFGPARIIAGPLRMAAVDDDALVQTGCSVRIDGIVQPTNDVDVDGLYASAASPPANTETKQ
ncbi:MAG: CotH kinase family protein [Phycisphaerales bacterium]|nr:CotH kinase family protein [Phycisphaerales bacterium]